MNAKAKQSNIISMENNQAQTSASDFCVSTDLFRAAELGSNVILTHKKGGMAGGVSEVTITIPKGMIELSWDSMLDVSLMRTFRGVEGQHMQNMRLTLGHLISQSLNGINETSYTNTKSIAELEEYGRALEAGHLTRASYKASFKPFDMKEWLSDLEKDESISSAQKTFWAKVREARRGLPALTSFLNDICLKDDSELKNSLWLKQRLLSAGYVPVIPTDAPDLY